MSNPLPTATHDAASAVAAARPAWHSWTSIERESFFAAIARHRRASWRVTIATALANVLMTVAVAVLTGPLFYSVLMLGMDHVLIERRLGNVIAEMCIAANLPAPRVLIAERATLNAAVFGRDERHATIVISQTLLERLNRDELQGIAGRPRAAEDAAHDIRPVGASCAGIGRRARRSVCRAAATWARRCHAPCRAGRSIQDDSVGSAGGAARPGRLLCRMRERLRAGPMLAVLWRQRKYMADATAVRLTRVAPARVPLRTLLIATPLCVILGALVAMLLALLVYLSLAVSLLVTGTSVGLVHVVLRWLGS